MQSAIPQVVRERLEVKSIDQAGAMRVSWGRRTLEHLSEPERARLKLKLEFPFTNNAGRTTSSASE